MVVRFCEGWALAMSACEDGGGLVGLGDLVACDDQICLGARVGGRMDGRMDGLVRDFDWVPEDGVVRVRLLVMVFCECCC